MLGNRTKRKLTTPDSEALGSFERAKNRPRCYYRPRAIELLPAPPLHVINIMPYANGGTPMVGDRIADKRNRVGTVTRVSDASAKVSNSVLEFLH